MINISNNSIDIKKDGYYRITAKIFLSTVPVAANKCLFELDVNGGTRYRIHHPITSTQQQTIELNTIGFFNIGNELKIQFFQNSGATITIGSLGFTDYNTFQVEWIGDN